MNPTAAIQNAAGHLIRRACRRLPADIRDECCREWSAEAWAILNDTAARPAARRYLAALRYAAGHVRGTRHHPHAQRPKRLRLAFPARQRFQTITVRAALAIWAISTGTWLVFLSPSVRSAAGGFRDAFGNILSIVGVILASVVIIHYRITRPRRGADHEPGQGP